MGCAPSVASSNKYDDLYAIIPKTRAYKRDFEALGISESDCGKLYHLFSHIDTDGSGQIEILELLMFLDVERTRFTKRIFSIFDDDKSGEIDFREFVLSIWNYCTLGKTSLTVFAFDLYDLDKSGHIDLDEAQTLIKDVYGAKFEQNVHARKTYNKLGALDTDQIDLESFKEFSRKHQALLYPAFEMQNRFQKCVVGNTFWAVYSKQRVQVFKDRYIPIEEILAQFEGRYNVGEKYKLGHLQSTEDVLDLQYTGDRGDFEELTPAQRLQDEAARRGITVGQLEQEIRGQKKHVIRNQRTGKDIIPVSRATKNNAKEGHLAPPSGALESKARERRLLARSSTTAVHPVESTVAMGGGLSGRNVSGGQVGGLRRAGTMNDLAPSSRRLLSTPSMTADGFEAAAKPVSTGGRRASVAAGGGGGGGGAPSLKGVARGVMVARAAGRRGSVT